MDSLNEVLDLGDELPHIDCSHKCPNELATDLVNRNKNSFSIIGFNIRSCRRNFASFTAFLSLLMIEFSLIVLYETWLTADVDYGFTLPGYEHIDVYRNNFGGGIEILYHSKFNIEVLDDLTFV